MNEKYHIERQLRDYFREVYLGGSYVYCKELGIPWNGNDKDIFIMMPRIMHYALVNILELIFDEVVDIKTDTNIPEYKIDRQWKRLIGYYNGQCYDLIFIDGDQNHLVSTIGSTISGLLYKIDFRSNIELSKNNDVKNVLQKHGCTIFKDKCTEEYIDKVIKICNKLQVGVNYA